VNYLSSASFIKIMFEAICENYWTFKPWNWVMHRHIIKSDR